MGNLVIRGVSERGEFVEPTETSPLVVFDSSSQKAVAGPFPDLVGASEALVDVQNHIPHKVDEVALLAIQMEVGHSVEDHLPRGSDGDLLREAIKERLAKLQIQLESKFSSNSERSQLADAGAPLVDSNAVPLHVALEYAAWCNEGGFSSRHLDKVLAEAGVDADSAYGVRLAFQSGGMVCVVKDFGESPQHAQAIAALQAYTFGAFKAAREAEKRASAKAETASIPEM